MGSDEEEIVPPGTVLGRYRVERRLGAGGMGAVYEARHTALNKRVAMKVLHPSLARDASVRARFVQEGEVAARIRHPNVVDVSDVATDGGITYLVMEYFEGEDLAALLKREAPLDPPRIADLMLPVISAISAAHAAGVIHRDLKPANVFLARAHGELSPKVLDFGISKILDQGGAEPLTRTGMVMGTPNYMAPEQVMSAKDLDGRADVYALGAILYECATGARAYDGGSMMEILVRITQGQFPRPSSLNPSIPPALEALILEAMAGDRERRVPSAQALFDALLAFADAGTRARFSAQAIQTLPIPESSGSPPRPPTAARAPVTASEPRPLTSGDLRAPARRRGPVIGAVAAVVGAGIAWALLTPAPRVEVRPERTPQPSASALETFTVRFALEPANATVLIDGASVAHGGALEATVPKDGRGHRLTVTAEGYEPLSLEFFQDVPPPAKLTLKALGKNDAPILR